MTLKEKRLEKGMNLIPLAELTGLTIANISLIERGLSKPSNKTRDKLEKVFGAIDFSEFDKKGKFRFKPATRIEAEKLLVTFTETLYRLDCKDQSYIANKTREALKPFK